MNTHTHTHTDTHVINDTNVVHAYMYNNNNNNTCLFCYTVKSFMGGKFLLPAQTAKNEQVKTGQHKTGKYMGNLEVQKFNYFALILFSTKYSSLW